MIFNYWLPVLIACAAADWLAVWHGWHKLSCLAKPGALLALLIWFGTAGRFQGDLLWFGAGFFLSLLGDVFLLLSHRFFVFGLGAFLLAHLAFIYAFYRPLPGFSIPLGMLAVLIALLWMLLYGRLRRVLRQPGAHAKMRVPVGVYSLAIAFMLFSALLTLWRADWSFPANGLAAAGGLLFFCSDTLLAFDRFDRPIPHARFWVRVNYHLAQAALAAGALLHHLG